MKWTIWFIMSVAWFLTFMFTIMIVTPMELQMLGKNWLFVFGTFLSIINLFFCVYIGATDYENTTM
jgi:hypothetical protein